MFPTPVGIVDGITVPTRPMKADAASARFYEVVESNEQRLPRAQTLIIADLSAIKGIKYPKGLSVTFKMARKGKDLEPETQQLA